MTIRPAWLKAVPKAKMRMMQLIGCHTKLDLKRSEEIKEKVSTTPIEDKMRGTTIQWIKHEEYVSKGRQDTSQGRIQLHP